MNPVPPGGFPQIIARLVVNVKPDAAGGSYPLRLVEGIGSPAIFNRFSVAGTSVVPTLEDGEFVVRGRNVLLLEKKRAIGGALVPSLQTIAFAQHVDALTGYSIAILYDCVALELVEATHVNTDVFAQLGQPNRIEFFLTDVDDTIGGNVCRSRTGVIFDFVDPFEGQALQPAPDAPTQSLMRYRWRVDPIANNGTEFQELVLDDRIGDISNDFLVGSDSIQPRRINGKIYFSTGTIVGQVVDIRTGGPVSGARVVTEPDEREAFTVNNGAFAIEDVIPGTYRLRIEKAGIYPARTDVVQVRGQNVAENVGQIGVYSVPGQRVTFRRALINPDGHLDISDGVWLLNWLFQGGPLPVCMQAADVNDDDHTDISDVIYFLNFLFHGGPQPNEPFVNCGTDEGDLSCESPPGCL